LPVLALPYSFPNPQNSLYSLGIVEVDVPYHGPEVVFYDTFPKIGGSGAHHK
jgi:hypothetical protein